MMDETIFVYGTLRAGGSNHFRLEGAVPRDAGTVRGRLYRVDWYPALLLDEGGYPVHGEVYEVDAVTLAALDVFEGSEYRRIRVAVTPAAAGDAIEAWVWEFVAPLDGLEEIRGGDWLEAVPDA